MPSEAVPTGTFVVNGKWYGVCQDCGSLVRIDKPILGSMHLCITESERAARKKADKEAP